MNREKEAIRKRIRTTVNPEQYAFFPGKKEVDFYDETAPQRVAVYVRVSTQHIQQTSSYELQKKYYEELTARRPNWTLVDIYADEGVSGTSLNRRDGFNSMIAHCEQGLIDLIVTKSISRFSRNVVDCITIIRKLMELPQPVGVYFENEALFSLTENTSMVLEFLSSMAQEESHIRSRSMETSLRMRLDGGLPLTPKLLGYTHDQEGRLEIQPEEAVTVKLIFYLYLQGQSTAQIAQRLNLLGRKRYFGQGEWQSSGVLQVLRNERHCGDVLTRKTFTPNYLTHKSRKNRGERSQSLYYDHHQSIVSREDFVMVQQMLSNAKYGNQIGLPTLRVVDKGLLCGYVRVHPRWANFQKTDYQAAVAQVEVAPCASMQETKPASRYVLDGFVVSPQLFFQDINRYTMVFEGNKAQCSASLVRKMGAGNELELLVNPENKGLALRTVPLKGSCTLQCSLLRNGRFYPRSMSLTACYKTLFDLFGWREGLKYRLIGTVFQKDEWTVCLFDTQRPEVFVETMLESKPLVTLGRKSLAIPKHLADGFGEPFHHAPSPVQPPQWEDMGSMGQPYPLTQPEGLTTPEQRFAFIAQQDKEATQYG